MAQPIIKAEHNYTVHPDLDKFAMHTHETYEIYCFLSGSAKYFVEGTVYRLKPNDILIMKKAEAHSLLVSNDVPYERMFVYFNADALLGGFQERLSSFLNDRPLGKFNRYPASRFAERRWVDSLNKICNAADDDTKRLYLTVLVAELAEASEQLEQTELFKDNIAQLIAYINRHLTEELSLERLCDTFYISKSHLNRKFKQLTGSTVWEYIKTKRLVMAKELLQNGVPPTEVASRCGFREYSAFFYAYKAKYGVSPKQDRFIPAE